jgi:hypothetical protein
MMLITVFDHLYDKDGNYNQRKFHIPEIEYYQDLGFPFHVDKETNIILDNTNEPAILTVELIESYHWEIIYEDSNR